MSAAFLEIAHFLPAHHELHWALATDSVELLRAAVHFQKH
jgi:hypothetical protein